MRNTAYLSHWQTTLLTILAMLIAALLPAHAHAASCPTWSLWQQFKTLYVSADGRVIDASTPARITTSEGQAYALLFALAGNDRAGFAQLLQWTENNLAQGNLANRLPAWQWGHVSDAANDSTDTWRILDNNAASDADVWMAYALSEAGRLWRIPRYTQLSRQLSDRILHEETSVTPGLGLALLPGPRGFVHDSTWRFNASYLPISALRYLSTYHDSLWQNIATTSLRIIQASSSNGYAADWIQYQPDTGFDVDAATGDVGSYNAIRVYLWAGMLDEHDPDHTMLATLFAPTAKHIATQAWPPEQVQTRSTALQGIGLPGFAAAFMPLLNDPARISAWRHTLEQQTLQNNQAYYSDALTLFGLGWLDGWLRFDKTGKLLPKWRTPCTAS